MASKQSLIDSILILADSSLILAQRLGEWCGHGPVLEQDMAMTNIALDYIGRSRLLYQYAAQLQGEGKSEDDLAFLRDVGEYKNLLLVEQENGHFGHTVIRQFFLEAFQFPFYDALQNSQDQTLKEIASKTIKETAYHLKWSTEWVIRLGDGTEESHQKIKTAITDLVPFTGELTQAVSCEKELIDQNIFPDYDEIKRKMDALINTAFKQAGLELPTQVYMHQGGKKGLHSELLGYILSDMQFLQRAYPGLEW
ncbi:MAG TPA: phenylacetate-CoA oxygenase subunit PaaC [Saprospiraceae bacterium]|nr:phenylacetate-CoA oxygenase subunit PaaC [Saprospiraceae bacterium]